MSRYENSQEWIIPININMSSRSSKAVSRKTPIQAAISSTIHTCEELTALVSKHTDSSGRGIYSTKIPQLKFMRQTETSEIACDTAEPTLAIVVQGKKEIWLGRESYRYGVAQCLLISVDLPIYGFAIKATASQPCLGIKLDLDLVQLCEIMPHARQATGEKGIDREELARGLSISNAAPPLMDCVLRLVKLLDTPQDIPFLAPVIAREIYYRLLLSEQSKAVRQIATSGSSMHYIADAIGLIKANFAEPLRIEDLAKQASMSHASFYRHFKAVTNMSPLQYQKQLRLLNARHLMLAERTNAANIAYQVGYTSPSHFSREYSRMFGISPIQDTKRLGMVQKRPI